MTSGEGERGSEKQSEPERAASGLGMFLNRSQLLSLEWR